MLAGMESIVAPAGRRTKDEWVLDNLTPLLGALFYLVITQVNKLQTGRLADVESYKAARKEMVLFLDHARQNVDPKSVDEEDFWDGWKTAKPKAIDEAIQMAGDNGWLESDWFHGLQDITEAIQRSSSRRAGPAPEGDDGEADEEAAKIQIRRPDTMFQERYNYLSEERLQDYEKWKAGILQRIEELEAGAPEPMEVEA